MGWYWIIPDSLEEQERGDASPNLPLLTSHSLVTYASTIDNVFYQQKGGHITT